MKEQPDTELLKAPLPAVDDREGDGISKTFERVVDSHVHVFPHRLFDSVWSWFDRFGWPVRYKLKSDDLISFLLKRGVDHIVALHYAHKPGIAQSLNQYMADLCQRHPCITGMATVFPGEENAAKILKDAFRLGLKGVKLHAHVQCFHMESRAMHDIYTICSDEEKPLVMHAGREPKSPHYPCDPYALCSYDRVEKILNQYPKLKLCVPHFGADEFGEYIRMMNTYDNLWTDNTMMLADYFPGIQVPAVNAFRKDRVMYGTDFPNIPYAWDREIKLIKKMNFEKEFLDNLMFKNAVEFYNIQV